MNPRLRLLFAAALALLAVSTASAQAANTAAPKQPPARLANSTGGTTPHETTSAVIEGNRVTIVYGRPYTKHPRTGEVRKVWGGLVPHGQVWRTGADEATLLITQQPIAFGARTVPAGAYTLWTLFAADGTGQLIVNRQIGQWGADRNDFKRVYDEANDVVRVPLTREPLSPAVDQFTFTVERAPGGGGVLRLKWDDAQYSAAFQVRK